MARSDEATHYYAHTMPGLEAVCWSEARERLAGARYLGHHVVPSRNGLARIAYDGSPHDLLSLRTADDVFLELAHVKIPWGYEGLSAIYNVMLQHKSLGDAIGVFQEMSGRKLPARLGFRVITRMSSKNQPYRRQDLERSIRSAVRKQSRGRWTPVESGEHIELWVNLLGLQFICGLRLSDSSMRHREYKVAHLPASLRPSVAAAMAWLTEPRPDDVFVDAMCGAGTILIERAMAGRHAQLLGGDLDSAALAAAAENLGRRHKPRQLFRWDAGLLPLRARSIGKAASNLPFGKQVGDPAAARRLHGAFIHELDRVLGDDGRAALLVGDTSDLDRLVRRSEGLCVSERHRLTLLGQPATIYVIQRPRGRSVGETEDT